MRQILESFEKGDEMSASNKSGGPESSVSYEPIYVARQPVFDTDMEIWGYELLFRHSADSSTASFADGNLATSKVIADGFGMAAEWLSSRQKVLINYPSSMLRKGTPRALPSDVAVVEILETVKPDREIVEMCRLLKNEGYTLALDDFVGDPGFEPFLAMADIIKVDVMNMPEARLREVVDSLRVHKAVLLAEKVEDLASFDLCRSLGFELFQGYFFSKPKVVSGRKITANQLSRMELIRELSADDIDMAGISRIVKADVSLSYRLLRYINSAGMGLAFKINSISQAITMLGQRRISTWLQVLIMAEMSSTATSGELLLFSLQRARFLERLSSLTIRPPKPSDTMFMLGLFSYLDALLSQPMEEILDKMCLDPELTAALLGQENKLSLWLKLAGSAEKGQWASTEAILEQIGMDSKTAAIELNKATAWAKQFLSDA